MAPTMERTPSATPSMYPDSVISLRGRNMAAVTTSATHTPMHRPNTGFSPTAVAKSTPWKKPPAYSMPRIEKMMSTMMGMIRSNTRPSSEMAMPLNSSTATFAASSSSSSSATDGIQLRLGSASAAFGSWKCPPSTIPLESAVLRRNTMLLVGRLLHLGLGNAHGAEVLLGSAHEEDEHDGEQRIEVVRDGLDERCETAFAQVAAYAQRPTTDAGATMQIGAAVESMIHASFSWLMLNRSVTGRMTAPTVRQLK